MKAKFNNSHNNKEFNNNKMNQNNHLVEIQMIIT